MTPEEKQRLSEKASAANMKVSEYMYCVVMNRELKVKSPEFKQNLKDLSSVSNNLNQIAHAGNKYGFLSPDDRQTLAKIVTKIYEMISEKV